MITMGARRCSGGLAAALRPLHTGASAGVLAGRSPCRRATYPPWAGGSRSCGHVTGRSRTNASPWHWGQTAYSVLSVPWKSEQSDRREQPDLAVLGCADGKFVLPAARLGFRVLAIDIDEIALYGGPKPGVGGTVTMPGLVARLGKEKLRPLLHVVC